MKNIDRLLVTLVFVLAIGLVIPLVQRQNIQKQYDLYKKQTDSLFAVTIREYESKLRQTTKDRDSLGIVSADLAVDNLHLRERERILVLDLKKLSHEKYQSMSAKEKQAEMIKRARE